MDRRSDYELTIVLYEDGFPAMYRLEIDGKMCKVSGSGLFMDGNISAAIKMFVRAVITSNATTGKFSHMNKAGAATKSDWSKSKSATSRDDLIASLKMFWFNPEYTDYVDAAEAMGLDRDALHNLVDEAVAKTTQ